MPTRNSKDRREARRQQAEKLTAERAKLTDEQQLKVLDKRFGEGQGAKKERARLAARIEARANQKANEEVVEAQKEAKKDKAEKKTKAPKKDAGQKRKTRKQRQQEEEA